MTSGAIKKRDFSVSVQSETFAAPQLGANAHQHPQQVAAYGALPRASSPPIAKQLLLCVFLYYELERLLQLTYFLMNVHVWFIY